MQRALGLSIDASVTEGLFLRGPQLPDHAVSVTLSHDALPPDMTAGLSLLRATEQEIDGAPAFEVHRSPSGDSLMRLSPGREFWISSTGDRVVGHFAEDLSVQAAEAALAGPVLAFAASRRGMLVIHAAAIIVEGEAILIAGSQGAGKSTLAAACCAAGSMIMADDSSALEKTEAGWVVHAGPRLIRLWPDSAESLDVESTRALHERTSKLGAPAGFCPLTAPVAGIVFLEDDGPASPTRVGPAEALFMMTKACRNRPNLNEAEQAQELKAASAAASELKCWHVRGLSGFADLPVLTADILSI
jgi:hypothetical protein